MEILIVGAGVVGLTSAYYLRRDGHDVTVVDQHAQVAAETSHANGGQLSYSYVAPLAGPGVLSKLPQWLARRDSPVRFRPAIDVEQWRWCLQFARACKQWRSELTMRQLLDLSFLSRSLLHALVEAEPVLQFDYVRAGKLVVHRRPDAFAAALRLLDFQRDLGCEQEALDAGACVRLEPALAHVQADITGGIYTPAEETGDCEKFCKGLETVLRAQGVNFLLSTRLDDLRPGRNDRVEAFAGRQKLDGEHIVVASGCASTTLLRTVGLRVPVYPLKGYSLTVNARAGRTAPFVSVTDFEGKIVYARLGDRLRVAGMADLVGNSNAIDEVRLDTLRREAQSFFPEAGDFQTASGWAGLRPATPNGTPIIGRSPYKNLWLNIGQGALGFTLATGSAQLLSEAIGRKPASLDGSVFSLQSRSAS
jgi:D-amino-acid dehydrogenase